MRVSVAALATLRRMRAAKTDRERWLAWKRAHPNVRASMRVGRYHVGVGQLPLVDEWRGEANVTAAGMLVLAGADAAHRSARAF